MPTHWINRNTPNAMPTVVLRSAVATVRRCSTPNSLAAAGSASTGRMSMKFSRNTMQKIVMASGAMNLFEP